MERQAIIQQSYYESSLDPTATNKSGGALRFIPIVERPEKQLITSLRISQENRGRSELDMQMDFFIRETETSEKRKHEKSGLRKGFRKRCRVGSLVSRSHVQRSAFYGEGDIDMRQVAGLQIHNQDR